MRFWDTSALVPLFVRQSATPRVRALLRRDEIIMAWWGTSVEGTSAIARLEREGKLTPRSAQAAMARLGKLASTWQEIQAAESIRQVAKRFLRVHDLRAADALQLAAAFAAAEQQPPTLELVTLDLRLAAAATREGFLVRPT